MSLSDWNPDPMQRVATAIERMAERQDRFYTEVLDLLGRITEDPQSGPDGSLHSGQPAAAPDGPALQSPPCVICGKEGNRYRVCMKGTELTKAQWEKHAEDEYDEAREHGAGKDTAWARAIEKANERFGPCPEES